MADLYSQLVAAARLHSKLYHYTNILSLEKILENNSLRASRLDKVNDSEENNRITSLWNNKVFSICFTYSLGNQAFLYKNYGKIRLTFNRDNFDDVCVYSDSDQKNEFVRKNKTDWNHHTYDSFSDWGVYDITMADVYYTESFDLHIADDGFESNAGLIKMKSGLDNEGHPRMWEYEKETRLRIAIRPVGPENVLRNNRFYQPHPPFKYVYIKLPPIEAIEVSKDYSPKEISALNKLLTQYGIAGNFTDPGSNS